MTINTLIEKMVERAKVLADQGMDELRSGYPQEKETRAKLSRGAILT